MKNKKIIILILILVFAIANVVFWTCEIYGYLTTGRSMTFAYKLYFPKDSFYIGYIQDEIEQRSEGDGLICPDVKSLCSNLENIKPDVNQPFTNYGINLLYNSKTGNTYLYMPNPVKILPKEKYILFSDTWEVLFIVNKALKEKPQGRYHAFIMSEHGNDWLTVSLRKHGYIQHKIDSWTPPIPGCVYNIKTSKFYIPSEILPAYSAIYPNLKIPVDMIIQSNIDLNE